MRNAPQMAERATLEQKEIMESPIDEVMLETTPHSLGGSPFGSDAGDSMDAPMDRHSLPETRASGSMKDEIVTVYASRNALDRSFFSSAPHSTRPG